MWCKNSSVVLFRSDAALSQTWQIGNNGCGVKTRNFGHFQGAGAGVLVFSMFFPPGQELLAQVGQNLVV